jgi:hypothetical protein
MTENEMRSIGSNVKEMIPKNCGYAVLVFHFDQRNTLVNFVTNGNHDDMIRSLKEMAQRLENGEVFVFNHN